MTNAAPCPPWLLNSRHCLTAIDFAAPGRRREAWGGSRHTLIGLCLAVPPWKRSLDGPLRPLRGPLRPAEVLFALGPATNSDGVVVKCSPEWQRERVYGGKATSCKTAAPTHLGEPRTSLCPRARRGGDTSCTHPWSSLLCSFRAPCGLRFGFPLAALSDREGGEGRVAGRDRSLSCSVQVALVTHRWSVLLPGDPAQPALGKSCGKPGEP